MSTEVTPDLLRRVAAAWEGGTASDDYARHELRARAAGMEHEQRPLPTEPGWYPSIVVERGGESCTGALLTEDGYWETPRRVRERRTHTPGSASEAGLIIRWAEQDGTTPGQTLWEETCRRNVPWADTPASTRARYGYLAAAVLAAHGTPTLTPVGEHPEPGTRGLLPVTRESGGWYSGWHVFLCCAGAPMSDHILADSRPGGA